ncbi:outer membrane protein assembly factor [Reichenbachiella agarivorans]|uniref:Outer membrane protein assembly factor n=1 Tax=Reichenbachiella agarivorans TaxID=2979464 RepID=A0ABY6CWS1_9BACT|nr:outer membrane protein assembly factor [Reichenbachiella agarivorans]UXP33838.1 outer membrane protein assembly factor [Reichenbachiella agarivorans]
MNYKNLSLSILLFVLITQTTIAQDKSIEQAADTLTAESPAISKFDAFNKKAEVLFQFIPFPIYSYSQETGQVYGLVKYNLINIVKGDTVSAASSFSALASASSFGQIKFVLGSRVYLNEDKIVIQGEASYINFPQFFLGIGNDVTRDGLEEIATKSYNAVNSAFMAVTDSKTMYAGVAQEYRSYVDVELDSSSYLDQNNVPGYEGGAISGLGPAFIFDTRDHKYNSRTGAYIATSYKYFGGYLGSDFDYGSFVLDMRKFINPWMNHVIGVQAYTELNTGTVPFYALALLGGSERMRGYYQGAIRDKAIADVQVEYRMPIWKIFGMVAFAGAGRVAPDYGTMNLKDVWVSGGVGLRIMVDSNNRANLRMDFGWGEQDAKAFVIGFTESF